MNLRVVVALRYLRCADHPLPGIVTVQQLRDVTAAEAKVAPSTLAFLQAALPAAPSLVLGFVFLEGRSLVCGLRLDLMC